MKIAQNGAKHRQNVKNKIVKKERNKNLPFLAVVGPVMCSMGWGGNCALVKVTHLLGVSHTKGLVEVSTVHIAEKKHRGKEEHVHNQHNQTKHNFSLRRRK